MPAAFGDDFSNLLRVRRQARTVLRDQHGPSDSGGGEAPCAPAWGNSCTQGLPTERDPPAATGSRYLGAELGVSVLPATELRSCVPQGLLAGGLSVALPEAAGGGLSACSCRAFLLPLLSTVGRQSWRLLGNEMRPRPEFPLPEGALSTTAPALCARPAFPHSSRGRLALNADGTCQAPAAKQGYGALLGCTAAPTLTTSPDSSSCPPRPPWAQQACWRARKGQLRPERAGEH